MVYTMLLFNVCLLFTVFLLNKFSSNIATYCLFSRIYQMFYFYFSVISFSVYNFSYFFIFIIHETVSLFSFFLLNINRNVLGVASWVLVPNAESWDIRVRASRKRRKTKTNNTLM